MLPWLGINNLVSVSYLMRAHGIQGRRSKKSDVNVGTLITCLWRLTLLVRADVVRRQRPEAALWIRPRLAGNSTTIRRFFKLPKDLILESSPKSFPGMTDRKCQELLHTIPFFVLMKRSREAVMGITTTRAGRRKESYELIIYQIHKLSIF